MCAAGAWQFTNTSKTYLLNGTFDLDTDAFKMALYTSSSNLAASSDEYSAVTHQVASTGLGYVEGGISVTLALTGTTQVKVDVNTDPIWTASGGSIVAKWAQIYEPTSSKLLIYCLLDSTSANVTIEPGNTLTVAANASGLFTLS